MTIMAGTAEQERQLEPAEVDLLVQYLDDEAGLQETLLERLAEKERHLVAQDLDALEACLKDTEPLVIRLEELTHRRIRVLGALAKRLGIPLEEVRLGKLLERSPADATERLGRAREALRDVLARVGAQNRRNNVLIRNGIELNRTLIHTIFGDGQTRRTYDRSANTREAAPERSFLDREL